MERRGLEGLVLFAPIALSLVPCVYSFFKNNEGTN